MYWAVLKHENPAFWFKPFSKGDHLFCLDAGLVHSKVGFILQEAFMFMTEVYSGIFPLILITLLNLPCAGL